MGHCGGWAAAAASGGAHWVGGLGQGPVGGGGGANGNMYVYMRVFEKKKSVLVLLWNSAGFANTRGTINEFRGRFGAIWRVDNGGPKNPV